MHSLVVLTPEGTHTVEADGAADHPRVSPDVIERLLGWRLEDRGMCRGDVCIPVPADDPLRQGGSVDLVAAAGRVGRESVIDTDRALAALAVEPDRRRSAISDGTMPEVTLSDLDGNERRFAEFGRRKKLLVAFASW